jgi:GH15 family glucan-1,4-alpha-glucosidase
VRRSLVTLKALTYEPSGGIVAAATTSLPETLGGSRNWDYRYCWIRDTAFTLSALLGTGLLEEARAWQRWTVRAAAGDPATAQIMYGIDGTRRLPEYELPWLSGYEGAAPVRVGNDAAGQLQLDVHGEALAAAHVARTAGIVPTERGWELQLWLAEHLEEAWKQPDNGIWESRGARQHFVYTKIMCWVAFDEMVKGVERFGLEGPVNRWRAVREEIHDDVCKNGYDAERGPSPRRTGPRR